MSRLSRLLEREPVLLGALLEAVTAFFILDSGWSDERKALAAGIVTAFNAWWVRVLSTPMATAKASAQAAASRAAAHTEEVIRALAVEPPKPKPRKRGG